MRPNNNKESSQTIFMKTEPTYRSTDNRKREIKRQRRVQITRHRNKCLPKGNQKS